jgi:hypothetical protein
MLLSVIIVSYNTKALTLQAVLTQSSIGDLLCGNPTNHCSSGDIFGHHCAGANDCPFANSYTWQDNDIWADEDVVFDRHFCFNCGKLRITNVVLRVENHRSCCDINVVANGQWCSAIKNDTLADDRVTANGNATRIVETNAHVDA